jgi:two-component system sensor histidine kinase QseC
VSLQKRLLLYLLLCAPLVWGVALYFSLISARHEVNELFDTELIRLARQVHATLIPVQPGQHVEPPPAPAEGTSEAGHSEVEDLAVAVWDRDGHLMLHDHEGVGLRYAPGASGFVDDMIGGSRWRVYYLHSSDGQWLVAVGQGAYERDELVYGLTMSQVVPWLLVLPILLIVMTWAVRRALSPMIRLTEDLRRREAADLRPVPHEKAPSELKPLLVAMNGLFTRIEELLVRERRFTADAAHELRTPLAVLRAQWDVVRRAGSAAERTQAEEKFGAGLDRMGHLVTQMLSLSRAETGAVPAAKAEIDWVPIVEQAMSDCLALAGRRHIDLACEWPADGKHPMPLLGDAHLLTVMLRNLLDNAVRYAPEGSAVTLRIGSEHLEVNNGGPALSPEQIQHLGQRFHRPVGQEQAGSGLGISIVQRIAQSHGLALVMSAGDDGTGVRAMLKFETAARRAQDSTRKR